MQFKLKEIANIRSGYPLRKAVEPDPDGEFQLIQIKDVGHDGAVSYDNLVRLNLDNVKSDYLIHRGEILFIARGNRSEAVLIDRHLDKTIFGLQFFAIEPGLEVLPEYLYWFINQSPAQRYFEANAVGSNVKLINKRTLEDLPVLVPPIEVQQRTVKLYLLSQEEQRLIELIQTKRKQMVEGALLTAIRSER